MKYPIIISVLIMICYSCSSNENSNGNANSESNKKSVEIRAINSETTLSELLDLCSAHSKIPILYFHADWCKPCVAFKKSLKDERITRVFENAMLLGVDIDSDPHNMAAYYSVNAVPTFIRLDQDSTVIARITSAEWDEDIPENIAPVMEKLLNQTVYNKN